MQRSRLLGVKYAAIVIFSLVATLTVTVTGIVAGLMLFGGGNLTLLSGAQIGFGQGLLRVLMASVHLALCFASLGAVGLFISTLTEQPIGAMIAWGGVQQGFYVAATYAVVFWLAGWARFGAKDVTS